MSHDDEALADWLTYRAGVERPDIDPPDEVFHVGTCTVCHHPVAHYPGDPGPYCVNDACPQSFDGAARSGLATIQEVA